MEQQELDTLLQPFTDACAAEQWNDACTALLAEHSQLSAAGELLALQSAYHQILSPPSSLSVPNALVALTNLSQVDRKLGEVDEALQLAQEALQLARQHNNRRDEGIALTEIGLGYFEKEDLVSAEELFTQAKDLFVAENNRRRIGLSTGNLGLVYAKQDRHAEALAAFKKALSLAREVEEPLDALRWLNEINTVLFDQEDSTGILEIAEEALGIARSLQVQSVISSALMTRGLAQAALSKFQGAIVSYQEALQVARAAKADREVAEILINLGNAYDECEQLELAIASYTESVEVARWTGDRACEGNALGELGLAYARHEQFSHARELLDQALELALEAKEFTLAYHWMEALQSVHKALGNRNEAAQMARKAQLMARALTNPTSYRPILPEFK